MTRHRREKMFEAALNGYVDARTQGRVACDVRRAPIYPLHTAPCACGFIPNGTTVETLAQAMIEHSLYHEALTAQPVVVVS